MSSVWCPGLSWLEKSKGNEKADGGLDFETEDFGNSSLGVDELTCKGGEGEKVGTCDLKKLVEHQPTNS